jgi:A/G-specific adenine glycosylase
MSKMSVAGLAMRWYDQHARDLPWREPGVSPWGVLVSEVMLQQTQVSRVEPAWREWLQRWPTPGDLANASAGDAIRAWGRLGYPRRALRLHASAVAVVVRHAGVVPDDLDALLALPGVGTYTARAVAAFAYRQRHPVVDTNVRRVIARAVTGVADAGPATTTADLRAVEALLPVVPEEAAQASIAFMELGAVVCTARAPRCADCPLAAASQCGWRLAGYPAVAIGSDPGAAGQPGRRTQGYAGTDRQVRGLLLAAVRAESSPVSLAELDVGWPDPTQHARALASLVADGLLYEVTPAVYALPDSPAHVGPAHGSPALKAADL